MKWTIVFIMCGLMASLSVYWFIIFSDDDENLMPIYLKVLIYISLILVFVFSVTGLILCIGSAVTNLISIFESI